MSRRIVLIGATGFFGRKLALRLTALDGIELTLTSRSAERARELVREIAGANVTGIAFDRDKPADIARLATITPWLVIDASGPFQSASYDLAHAALEFGAHWIDLADARDYLLGFAGALDPLARSKGLVARAGASSTPALSTAVVEDLTRGWRRLDTVDTAIMPGGAGEVGEAVIRAVLSYAGTPVATFAEGAPASVIGWGSSRRLHVEGLGVRHVSPVETADAVVLPERFGVTSRVTFSAGLESRLEHFGMLVLAKLRKRGLVGNLESLAPALEASRRATRLFATDRGGMIVDCTGLDATGRPVRARWLLIAERNAGPNVPVLPALALTRALLAGAVDTGAGIAIGVLPLAAIEAEMRAPMLTTSRTIVANENESLFERALGGDAYRTLPPALTNFHDTDGAPVWTGKADITASPGMLSRIVRALFGFPPSGRDVPVIVTVDRGSETETWTRNFAGRRFASQLKPEGGNVVSERFGPFKILLGISAANSEIAMPVVGWRLGPIPLPLALAPKSETREFADADGRFHFDVAISLPLAGVIAHYQGWLEPKTKATAAVA